MKALIHIPEVHGPEDSSEEDKKHDGSLLENIKEPEDQSERLPDADDQLPFLTP
jgi:hypothetical protein